MTRWNTLQSFRTDILVSHPPAHPWDTNHSQWGWKPWLFKESQPTGKQRIGFTLLIVQFPSQGAEAFWLVVEHIHWASSHGFCSGEFFWQQSRTSCIWISRSLTPCQSISILCLFLCFPFLSLPSSSIISSLVPYFLPPLFLSLFLAHGQALLHTRQAFSLWISATCFK